MLYWKNSTWPRSVKKRKKKILPISSSLGAMQNRPLKTNLLCKHLLIWHHSIGRTALQLWEFDFFLSAFCAGSSSKSNAINQYLLLWVPQGRIGSLAFPISLVKVKLIILNSLASFFIFFIFNIVLALNSSKRGGCVLKKQRHAAREVEWDSNNGKILFYDED